MAAAYTLAQQELEVLVLEKGDYPGAKNVTGGRIYVSPVRDLFPDLWAKAPLERFIAHEGVTMMAKERSVSIAYHGQELLEEPYQSYSILRAKFDRWFAKQAERKGAMLVTKSRVDEVIIEDGKVCGVWAGGDELRADVVIACDGVLSLTAEKAGLRRPGNPHDFAVGFKEVIELPAETIENRFNLTDNEGAAHMFMGEVTRGKFGGGFLYTNKESLSLGIVVGIKDLMEDQPAIEAPVLLDEFKQRPEIAALIRGGETVEYSAHVIPEGGLNALTKLTGNGIVVAGDAAGFSMNIGVTVRGMEYALASGYYAAQAVLKAREAEDYSAGSLAVYEQFLTDSFVMKDFYSFRNAPEALENPRLFTHYPELLGNVMRDMYHMPAGPKDRLYPTIMKYIKVSDLLKMFGDFRKVKKI